MKKPACPKCNKKDEVIPISYGFPTPEVFEKEQQGKVKLGGCCIELDGPDWYCKRDDIEF